MNKSELRIELCGTEYVTGTAVEDKLPESYYLLGAIYKKLLNQLNGVPLL